MDNSTLDLLGYYKLKTELETSEKSTKAEAENIPTEKPKTDEGDDEDANDLHKQLEFFSKM